MLRALRQLDDPAFLRTVIASVLGALAGFAALGYAVWLAVHHLLGWNAWLAGALGGASSALLAHYLFLPTAGAVATLFADPVAAAVERRFYPGLPRPIAAHLLPQLWDGLVLGSQILVLQLLALALTPVLPGVSLLLGYVVAAWAVGRGIFVAVAMRRMSRKGALGNYRLRRGDVLVQGSLAVALSLLPLANLLVPVLTIAAMVHVLHGGSRRPDAEAADLARLRRV